MQCLSQWRHHRSAIYACTPFQIIAWLSLFSTVVVNATICPFLILLTTSLVDFQLLLIESVTTQSTIAFHQIINIIVLGNAIIRPSDATVRLLLATDSGMCIWERVTTRYVLLVLWCIIFPR